MQCVASYMLLSRLRVAHRDAVQLFDPDTGEGTGPIDYFEDPRSSELTLDMVEKWWCLGDARNRKGMWVQGRSVGNWS